ncbi:uncharacterized protein LOC132747623 [Ruditapes philippinarum]|uniref:uncharacterized protein LOC132747623 n=1 Tax=Ruditapes philippinarum TaxID=129788 RepID=UPI00295AB9F3|nr:uncharacterized protein LOC132747623 [Ruditapes philippinarum]
MKLIRHCGSIIRDMIKVYVSLLPTQRYPLHIFLLMIFAISVSSQPLYLPAETFKCGPDVLNLSCERWGYDACITDGGDSYCMPCNVEYLASLCGTPEEITGCNLYCTQMVVDEEVKRAKVNFTEQLEYIAQQRYSSNIHGKTQFIILMDY